MHEIHAVQYFHRPRREASALFADTIEAAGDVDVRVAADLDHVVVDHAVVVGHAVVVDTTGVRLLSRFYPSLDEGGSASR